MSRPLAAVYEWRAERRLWARVSEPEGYRSARERRSRLQREACDAHFAVATERDHGQLGQVVASGVLYLEPGATAPN